MSFISGPVKVLQIRRQCLNMTEILFTAREAKPKLNKKKLFLQGGGDDNCFSFLLLSLTVKPFL